MVLGVGVVIGVLTLTFFPKQQTAQAVLCNSCNPHVPEPGPARPWEVDIPVSTYSQVNTRHGNVFTAIPVVSWSGIGPDMNMMLYHNSAAVADTTFAQAVGFNLGPGWSISYSDRLLLDQLPSQITLVRADGTRDAFGWNSAQQNWNPSAVHDVLTQVAGTLDPTWRVTHKNQSYHEFRQFGGTGGFARLDKIVDATGNAANLIYGNCGASAHTRLERVYGGGRYIDFQYTSGPCDRVAAIFDPRDEVCGPPPLPSCTINNRSWTFEYAPTTGWLSKLTGPRGKPIDLTYDPDGSGRIRTISERHDGATGPAWTYTYTGGRLTLVNDPTGDGGGLTQGLSYQCESCPRVITVGPIAPDVNLDAVYTDRRGNSWLYRYSGDQSTLVPTATIREIWHPANGERTFGFDQDRNLLRSCDRPGGVYNCWFSTYDSNGNRLTLTDPLNNVQSWTYDGFNNVTSSIDAAGNTARYYYDRASDTPTPYPTLRTRIVEPNESGNPPPNQPAGQEGTYPVTRLNYYLTGGCSRLYTGPEGDDDYACRGQLQEVTDPNGVWTGFSYDQWGQSNRWREGKYTTTTAAAVTGVCGGESTSDSGGFGTGGSSSGGGGGTSGHDSDGNPTSSTCIAAATAGAGSGANWFPFVLPCSAPNLPERSAQFFSAEYGPRNELKNLPLSLDDGKSRTHSAQYDVMGRQKQAKVVSNEAGGGNVPRTFDYAYDVSNGRYTRTGPDGPGGANGGQTVAQIDSADRVAYVERRASAAGALLMRADYTYQRNDLVQSVTYTRTDAVGGPGASVYYSYDPANRVTQIEHRNAVGQAMLRMDYSYTLNDLPQEIIESTNVTAGGTWLETGRTTFGYDRRSRLTSEYRSGQNSYQRGYVYDAGGNRTLKIDSLLHQETRYHYDRENPTLYGSNNNRLMYSELYNTVPNPDALLSTTYYEYSGDGNVTRVITASPPSGGIVAASAAASGIAIPAVDESPSPLPGEGLGEGGITAVSAVDDAPSPLPGEGWGEGGGGMMAAMGGGGTGCTETQTKYTAIRFGYAHNGQAVTFVHNESWCWNGVDACEVGGSYQIPWAREFRYDGARARYMNRELNPSTLATVSTTWSDYDGDETYGDFTVASASPWTVTNTNSYEPGLWRKVGTASDYLHNDHLGTLRQTSNTTGAASGSDVFSAFGERQAGNTDRFGYVGAWGYQAATSDTPSDPYVTGFPYLHVGARYYDPSSGRFLQRDPIGIVSGSNVYGYVGGNPTSAVDPSGLFTSLNPVTVAGAGLTAADLAELLCIGTAATAGAAAGTVAIATLAEVVTDAVTAEASRTYPGGVKITGSVSDSVGGTHTVDVIFGPGGGILHGPHYKERPPWPPFPPWIDY